MDEEISRPRLQPSLHWALLSILQTGNTQVGGVLLMPSGLGDGEARHMLLWRRNSLNGFISVYKSSKVTFRRWEQQSSCELGRWLNGGKTETATLLIWPPFSDIGRNQASPPALLEYLFVTIKNTWAYSFDKVHTGFSRRVIGGGGAMPGTNVTFSPIQDMRFGISMVNIS